MTDALLQISWLAVTLATIAHSMLGGWWFMVLFGKQYANACRSA